MAANFSSIPVLDVALATDQASKPEFLEQLRCAVINVGFLYLKNHPVPPQVINDLSEYMPRLFDLPQEAKDKCLMINTPHFLGYAKLGAEITKNKVDYREQFDIGTPHETKWKPGAPEYVRMWGPSQWPDEAVIPGFRNVMELYLAHVEKLNFTLIALLAEAFGLPSDAFDGFFDSAEFMQHRAKLVKYPAHDGSLTDQGIGPHFDAGFFTFVLQVTPHRGLQAQNLSGQWIDVPPIPGTFTVNVGKALEFVTCGLARATSHRVLSPPVGSSPRYSVPFRHYTSLHVRLADHVLDLPPEMLKLKELRGDVADTEPVNYTEWDRETSGMVNLIGRIKSHPEVAEHHYPDLFKRYFPSGLPKYPSSS